MSNSILEIFENPKNNSLYFYLKDDNFVIETNEDKCLINLDSDNLEKIALLLELYSKDFDNLFTWELKNIVVFFKKNFGIDLSFGQKIYDLSIISSYFYIEINRSVRIKDIKKIIELLSNTESWSFFEIYYKEIYIPLISETLPEIESRFLIDIKNKRKIYCHYEVEGQLNGRMSNKKISNDYYLPHNLKEEDKENIRLPSDQDIFLYFDYKHMEVSVLEWLSGDKKLRKAIESEDFYEYVWKSLTNNDPTEEQRKLCKNIFLPIIFGQGSKSLSKKIGLSEKNSSKLIYRIKNAFPVAFTWVNSQEVDSNNYSKDVFYRRRKFDENEYYKLNNFCIQSPSSMICLRKLVKLHELSKSNNFKIVFHVHDGYIISCDRIKIKKTYNIVKNILEEQDDLFNGLLLKTSCSYGYKLNNLKSKLQ